VKADAANGLGGVLENVVYSGTDTQFHVRLPNGERFIVRRQNSRDGGVPFAAGEQVGIRLQGDAAQVLRD
jgi:spermidine/putrescine transport system ATP-binding protein